MPEHNEKFMPDYKESLMLALEIIRDIIEDIKNNPPSSNALAAPWYNNLKLSYVFLDEIKLSYVFLDEKDHYNLKYGLESVKHGKIRELYDRFTVNCANLLQIINIIKENYANKEWENDWIYDTAFKEICNIPIEIPGLTCPPMDSNPLSGVFLLHCLYSNKFHIPERFHSNNPTENRQHDNEFYSAFNSFATSIIELLEWESVDDADVIEPLLKPSNKRAETLYWIYFFCDNLSDGLRLKSTLQKDDVYYTDITAIHTESQKQFLLLQTLLYIHLSDRAQNYFLQEEWGISSQLITSRRPVIWLTNETAEFDLRRRFLNRLADDDNPDIISLIYKRIVFLHKAIFFLHYQDFLFEIATFVKSNVPITEYRKEINDINKPIGWHQGEYQFHELTKCEFSSSVACNWKKFYEENENLLKKTFHELSDKQLEELWNIAQTVFLVINHQRYELNLNDTPKLTRKNRVKIIKSHEFNANTYMPEFFSTIIVCRMLESLPAKRFQIIKFSNLHKNTSGRSIAKNLQTYVKESPILIPLIIFFVKWTNNVLLTPFSQYDSQNNYTENSEPISEALYQP